MASVAFSASEYQADGTIRPAAYAFAGSTADGWEIRREGRAHLRLGPGYRLLRSSHCGVCATDLVRRHLPFPLPQVTGHEVVACDDDGSPVVVEINASHAARGLAPTAQCAFCRSGLPTHCPERLVLGIHDLPGGFSPWLLAPVESVLRVPPPVSPLTATLAEPFAAALHAITSLALADGDRVAVLGPRRLGGLVVAGLDAWRRRTGVRLDIVAVARRPEMRALARALGADDALDAAADRRGLASVVIDTTGSPEGLAIAARLATRAVHLKSTTGRPSAGLQQVTALVVDELRLAAYDPERVARAAADTPPARHAALLGDVPRAVEADLRARGLRTVRGDDAAALAAALAADPGVPLGGADLAVVTSLAGIDAAVRPRPGTERGLVRARGSILVADVGQARAGLLAALLDGRLEIGSSRCGDLRAALALLADPALGLGERLGAQMVTGRLAAARLTDAFAAAADPRHVKVIAVH